MSYARAKTKLCEHPGSKDSKKKVFLFKKLVVCSPHSLIEVSLCSELGATEVTGEAQSLMLAQLVPVNFLHVHFVLLLFLHIALRFCLVFHKFT